jgi:hypothetical protein
MHIYSGMLSTIASSAVLIPMLITAVAGVISTRGRTLDLRARTARRGDVSRTGGRRSRD